MKLSFLKQFISGVVVTLMVSGLVNAQEIVTLDFLGATGAALDDLDTDTFDIAVEEDPTGELTFSVTGITGEGQPFGTGGALEVFGSLGIDTDGEFSEGLINTGESFTLAFNNAVDLLSIDLTAFATNNTEQLFIGNDVTNVTIDPSEVDGDDIFDFDGEGLSFEANEAITFTGSGVDASFGLQALTLNFDGASVPEPSSIALLGLLGVGAVARRRR